MAKREPNGALARLLAESRWTHRQFARAVNRVGTETGIPLRYDESAVSHWLGGTVPRGAVRGCILEALSRRSAAPSPMPRPDCPFHTIAPPRLRIPWKG
ncbi:hypothetical protein E4K10_47685 [Streptomyces sp. T1317-0309]|nr:hypothetical protein E4K10_47685 [Streptomyces sp. T1317-0309]